MKPIVTISALLFLVPLAAAQETADTTSAWRYFPLAVGNVWEYEGENNLEGVRDDQRRAITGDSLIDGVRWLRYETQRVTLSGEPIGPLPVAYVRFDTTAAALRYLEGAFEPYGIPWGFPLDAPFGSGPEYFGCNTNVSGGYEQSVEIGEDAVITSVKIVDVGSCEYATTFAAGVGFVEYTALGGYLTLRYARIGGTEYGEAFTVSSESGAVHRDQIEFQVYPNPARSEARVALALREASYASVIVYDVLGREIAVIHDGPLSAGDHTFGFDGSALPSGLYLLRVETDGETLARRLTLIP